MVVACMCMHFLGVSVSNKPTQLVSKAVQMEETAELCL